MAPLSGGAPSAIRTVFWDVGGVLLTNGLDEAQRRHAFAPFGIDFARYESLHAEHNALWERGLCTSEQYFERTLHVLDPELTYPQFWAAACAESHVLHPGAITILSNLQRENKVSLATLNNESRELNEYRLDAFNLRQFFRYFLCSGYLHEMKPAAGLFQAAIDISGHSPGESLFIDDKEENCAAARSMGLQASVFTSPAQLRATLASLGISA